MPQDNSDSSPKGKTKISLSFIIRELGDDPTVVKDMLLTFREVILEFDAVISKEPQLNHFDNLKIALHKIKPSIRMFRLNELLQKIDDVETNIHNTSDANLIQDNIIKIRQEIPSIINEIDLLVNHY